MSATDTTRPAGQGATLSINLSSNNPFRNRAASPLSFEGSRENATSPFDDPEPNARPVSRNPFFDQSEPVQSPTTMSAHAESKSLSAEEIFNSLTLDDKAASKAKPADPPNFSRRPTNPSQPLRRGENVPPRENSRSRHRPTRSQEEALRARKPGSGPRPPPGPSSSKPRERRPRRNSDTSLIDLDARPITEEERKMIEEKRREAEKKRRDGKDRGKERSKSGKPSRKLDIIDQLDATSIYGMGMFHHDGPFDALNPHRNRQNSRRAPMQAFPKDSLNNSLGGAGPLNKNPDHATFMGVATDEAFTDYAGSRNKRAEQPIFDSNHGPPPVHGEETHGLGTSTFLEGTPAARTAIVRHQAEQAQEFVDNGLARKKSLAHRIRNINKGPRDYNSSARSPNAEGMYSRRSPDALSPGSNASQEANPFLVEFSKGEESISVRPRDGTISPDSGPRRLDGGSLERRATTDATIPTEEAPNKPSGILGRMKSLKGPRKPRNTDMAASGNAV